MKIFIGMQNTGSLMSDYGAGFRALGHEVFCVTESSSAITSDAVDLNIAHVVNTRFARRQATEQERRAYATNVRRHAWQKALEADVCMFIWNSFREDASDLPELKNAIEQMEDEVDELEAQLKGCRPRKAFGIVPRDW